MPYRQLLLGAALVPLLTRGKTTCEKDPQVRNILPGSGRFRVSPAASGFRRVFVAASAGSRVLRQQPEPSGAACGTTAAGKEDVENPRFRIRECICICVYIYIYIYIYVYVYVYIEII